jgi:hypothetical protein
LLEQPGEHPEAQERVLSLVEIDLAEGPAAARQAAVRAFAELAMSDDVRDAITAFFQRGRGSSAHD